MRKFRNLADAAVLHTFDVSFATERRSIADVIACIIEVDERRLYLALGFDSTLAYCVARDMSKHCAYKRIRAARAALRFPALEEGLEDRSLRITTTETQLAARRVDVDNSWPNSSTVRAEGGPIRARIAPATADRDLLNLPIRRATTVKLKHAAELMGHAVPSGDMAEVLDRVLDLAIAQLERRKCARTDSPRPRRSHSRDSRHVPAHVRRAVWERDGGQCTFAGDGGHRCGSRTRLEFDHIAPVACGGEATVANLRLLCRAHNQLEAERRFGGALMRGKREQARERVRADVRLTAPRANPSIDVAAKGGSLCRRR